MRDLIVILAVVFAVYLISLRLHPWRRCRPCGGTGRHVGAVFTYSSRLCHFCGGNGRRARLGVYVFYRSALTWGERAPMAAAERRGRNLGR